MEKDSFRVRASRLFDIPQDIPGGLLHIEMTGDREVFVENHKGILELSENEVILSFGKAGKLHIQGSNLAVTAMNPEEIRLSGIIENVAFGG
ncbi:MAG: YabP/YqfC family sporulation protein [Oscillospiraceae bacterium]|nr:YabP/YqfC family sporulation protein [Oscillospiraceae bacterium]